MSRHVFSEKSLARVIRAGDPKRFGVDLKSDRKNVLEIAAKNAASGAVDLSKFTTTSVKGKPCTSYADFHSHLVLRSISIHLQRRLRIQMPNRERIIRGVIEALMDSTPMYVVRRDIKTFYESISVKPVRDRLLLDTASSSRIRGYIREFFRHHCSASDIGLPRGIGLSALVAEISMQAFDRNIRAIEGVYKYYRFSDDIIIFSYRPLAEIAPKVRACLPQGMDFNVNKQFDVALDETLKKNSTEVEFEYLGYQFITETYSGSNNGRPVAVRVSPKKIQKFKSRSIIAFKQYRKDRNFDLLRDRLLFLASNYSVRRHGFAMTGGATHVKSGIYYNYKQCGNYDFRNRRMSVVESSAAELKELDGYVHSLLLGSNSEFAPLIAALNARQQSQLRRVSFYKGYSARMTVRFHPDRVREIKRAWLHV